MNPMILIVLMAIIPLNRESVRQSFDRDYRASLLVQSNWQPGHNCDPGEVSAEFDAAALSVLNWIRGMSQMEPLVEDFGIKQGAVDCAHTTRLSGQLRHVIPPSAPCATAAGIESARWSLIAPTSGPIAATQVAASPFHRSWVQFSPVVSVGNGSNGYEFRGGNYDGTTCFQIARGNDFDADRRPNVPFSWPPAGYFPFQACPSIFYWSWSPGVRSRGNDINFDNVTVKVTDQWGGNIPIGMVWPEFMFADPYVIFIPLINNYRPRQDSLFRVEIEGVMVNGVETRAQYPVILFDADTIVNQAGNWTDYQ